MTLEKSVPPLSDMKSVVFALILSPTMSLACPPAPDVSGDQAQLYAQLQQSKDGLDTQALVGALWSLWLKAPDASAQSILDRGIERRQGYDFVGAIKEFDMLIAYCPNYAEGYNQRGFVHFLRQDYQGALSDIDRALALSPNHTGALSGKALSLLALGQIPVARQVLQKALRLNPWLPERNLAQPGGPLAPPGKDI